MKNRTKQCKNLHIIFSILHFICLFGPFLYFIPQAYIIGERVQKIALSSTLIISIILAALSVLTTAKTRGGLAKSIMWLIIIGIALCLKEVTTMIYIMAILAIIDELFIVKMKDRYLDAYRSNREIDRRGV